VKIVFLVFLGILALNALVIVAILGILFVDHWKVRRRRARGEAPSDDAPAGAS